MELMQREDYLALCKGPANGGRFFYDGPSGKGWGQTHSGWGQANQRRILEDWFPTGHIFLFLNTTCFSRGTTRSNGELGTVQLHVLAPAPEGGMQDVYFSVREALSIAKQISVDTINRLNSYENSPS
jgi:hypothetical protein